MASKLNLLASSVFRGLQMLFAVVVVGLSVTLVKNHNNHNDHEGYPGPPIILPLVTAAGALSLVAAVLSLAIAWTNFLREYIEMLVDVVVIMANIVGGTIMTIKLKGKKCGDASVKNRLGSGQWPYTGSLGNIDILNGGCTKNYLDQWSCYNTDSQERLQWLNVRCKQSRTDSVFMFLTVVVLFATIALTFLRMRKSFRQGRCSRSWLLPRVQTAWPGS